MKDAALWLSLRLHVTAAIKPNAEQLVLPWSLFSAKLKLLSFKESVEQELVATLQTGGLLNPPRLQPE